MIYMPGACRNPSLWPYEGALRRWVVIADMTVLGSILLTTYSTSPLYTQSHLEIRALANNGREALRPSTRRPKCIYMIHTWPWSASHQSFVKQKMNSLGHGYERLPPRKKSGSTKSRRRTASERRLQIEKIYYCQTFLSV